ncbi:MAG: 30S ribosomal protein S3 [Patescibacteria group bacterium]|jgi:small subunit ribosomal protein S3|nr:30S ribosomal protein S3 [Patescibacteria group bacterium]
MGHKVNPKVFRIGNNNDWASKWFYNCRSQKNVGQLKQDVLIREFLIKKLKGSSVDEIQIERSADEMKIIIYTARPGFIIGRSGQGIEKVKETLKKSFDFNKKTKFEIIIKEIKDPNLSARVILETIALDLEKRIPYRRTLKKNIEQVKKANAQGVKVVVSGRLDGAEIARQETLSYGKIPLHTVRANIDYAQGGAQTIYGTIGVKVWICKGEIFKGEARPDKAKEETDGQRKKFFNKKGPVKKFTPTKK